MVTKIARKEKKRGPNRQTLTLGGEKKMEKSLKRRTKRKMNRDLGKAGIPARKKSRMKIPSLLRYETMRRSLMRCFIFAYFDGHAKKQYCLTTERHDYGNALQTSRVEK